MLPAMSPEQKQLLPSPPPPQGITIVNDHVLFRTEGTRRVISVQGVVFAHYDVTDRAAEAYAMVTLFESGYADQNDIARAFGFSTRSLRRYQHRFEVGGLAALARPRGRPVGKCQERAGTKQLGRTILHLKAKGFSNRAIAGRVGLDEKAIRKRLRRLGWEPVPVPPLAFPSVAFNETTVSLADTSIDPVGTPSIDEAPALQAGSDPLDIEPLPKSLDVDPLHRSMDRLLAAMGVLEDAAPLFAPAASVPRAGVLLAIPSLVSSGLLGIAERIYGTLGPAFYGLRTTLVTYVLLALLRIRRPEGLKEYAPGDLGRVVGLDRIPEVKTLRRKLTRLASLNGGQQLGHELARRRITERGRVLGFLYVDGHVRAYHGKHTIPKAYLARRRLAVPATTDYWVNDQTGDPLLVVTGEANASMFHMLVPILQQVRQLLGPDRRATIVFDRGGWSPKLFLKVIAMDFNILTYRKGRVRRIAEKRFILRKAILDAREVEYLLHDQPIRLLKGKLRLRQVTRLLENGHQTPILTSRWDLSDIVVAYRMFERWRQENFFKYMREEYLIDALADYQVEPDDPTRSVPNPAWKELDKQLHLARTHLRKLQKSYGCSVLDSLARINRGMKSFPNAEKKIRREIRQVSDRIADLVAKRNSFPKRVPVADTQKEQQVVKLSTERKYLTNVLKMVAYQIESDLVELLRPHYARVDDEGRTLIQTALQSTAAIKPTKNELGIILAPLSSPHRSRAVAAICESLNATNTHFPGTSLRMHFGVAKFSE
jgi:hypothetical protein